MSYNNNRHFDVIILGSGLAGSILATILARHNLRVLMIDKAAHPRFAVGEAMTPSTDIMMNFLSYKYSVPEIGYLSSFDNICNNISPSSCGLKRSFNFIYHQEGKKQTLQEVNKIGVHPNSSHLFRQDIDQYMAKVAVSYGAELLENKKIINLNIHLKGIEVEVERENQFTANYLVDASGYSSLLSRKFNLRENPTRFKTYSRSIFTHMIDVKRYDDCIKSTKNVQDEIAWHQGTLHHIFDGGWMWVIPFNNHKESNNPICSVGLNLDSRRYPKVNDIYPEQEFRNFLSRFPDIAIQFENAKSVRNWISTDRLQYSSHSCMGERFFLLSHAAGFVDPLYSFGMVNACKIIDPLASRIMKAISEDNYSKNLFADIEILQQNLLNYNDILVNCSYISFQDFNLWDAWRRVWMLGAFIGQMKTGVKANLKIAAGRGQELSIINNNDKNILDNLTPPYEGLGDDFFQNVAEIIENVEKKLLSSDVATQQIFKLLNSIKFLPHNLLNIGNFQQSSIDGASDFCKSEVLRFLSWVKTSQKPEAEKYFEYDDEDLIAVSRISTQ
jgi:tetracycline 7-halogenase / FADH2 O2-dependent halogenase